MQRAGCGYLVPLGVRHVVRYEDLVAAPAGVLQQIGTVLGRPLSARRDWAPGEVSRHMLKLDRHALLKSGSISKERVGIWKSSGRTYSAQTHETAALMGF